MSSIYNELDLVIADYVGYEEDTWHCADPELYDSITDECTRYVREELPTEHLSGDAKACIDEWEGIMLSQSLFNEGKEF